MGACAGKGAAPKDPDKVPQDDTHGNKKERKKKGRLPEADQTTPAEHGAKTEEETGVGSEEKAGTGSAEQDKQSEGGSEDSDKSSEEEEEKPVALTAPIVAHLPPPPSKDVKDTKVEEPKPSPSPPEHGEGKLPATVTEQPSTVGVKPEDVSVTVIEETPKESPIVKTYPEAWKPAPLRSTFSSFSPTPQTSKPTSPPASMLRRDDNATVKVESSKEEKTESNMTVTVESRTITKESTDSSIEKMRLPNLGEPISAESIIQTVREKTKDTGISMSSASKTTTVIKKIDTTGKEIVDIKTTETRYDGPAEDGKDRDVFVKTTSTRYAGDTSNVPETVVKTKSISMPPSTEPFVTNKTTESSTERQVITHKSYTKEPTTPVENLDPPKPLSTAPVVNGTKTPPISPSKDIKLEELVIRETADESPKPSQQSPSPSVPKTPPKLARATTSSSSESDKSSSSSSSDSSPETKQKSALPKPTSPTSKTPVAIEKVTTTPSSTVQTSLKVETGENVTTLTSPSASSLNGSVVSEAKQPSPSDDVVMPVDAAAKRKITLKNILCDTHTINTSAADKHAWCPNTRVRLMTCIDKWANGEDRDKDNFRRVWTVTGKSGMGKSAIAAEVLRKHSNHVAGAHFFQHRSPILDNNDARYVLRSFAFQMCDSLPKYHTLLPGEERLQELVDSGDLAEMFEVLMHEPLLSSDLDHNSDEPVLVILDAIDECNPQTRSQLLQLINSFSENSPDWLYLLVTTRDENQILSQLENVRTLELKNSNDNLADIKRYLKDPMSLHMDRITLDGGLTQLAKKTDGNFLCAKYFAGMLTNMPSEKKIALRDVEGLFPKGLNATYNDIFKSFKQALSNSTKGGDAGDSYQKVLGILCCTLEPISLDFITVQLKLDMDIVESLRPVLDQSDGCLSWTHRNILEWLHNQQESGEYYIPVSQSRQHLAECCWKWLEHIHVSNCQSPVSFPLQKYALKRGVWHLLDTQKQQENVASLLCELRYIEEKFQIAEVAVRHVLSDYRHAHQYGSETSKLITMSNYMKKHPKLLEQMLPYYNFVKSEGSKLQQTPDFTIHIAANYPNCVRIQQNARLELEGKHWLEELTSHPETHNISKGFAGEIEAADLSPDGKTLAILSKDDQQNLALCFINIATCEKRMEPVDIKMLKDRIGMCVKYLVDGNAVFVGSITTFINPKIGKPIPSGIDATTVQMKEKFAIECCNISRKYLACGLSTFPWGGRSLHLSIFDLKTKKSTKTFEVLKFRFGGSAQFGIKCCALSDDDTMLGACVKQSNKEQLVCSIWCLSKWTVLHTVNVPGDLFSRCLFVNNASMLIGSSVTPTMDIVAPVQTQLWEFKAGKTISNWDEKELCSIFNASKSGYVSGRWYIPNGKVVLQQWSKKDVKSKPQASFVIHGLDAALDVVSSGDHVLVITKDELKSYNVSDLQPYDPSEGNGVMDVITRGITFHPKSDEAIITYSLPKQHQLSVGLLTPKPEDLSLSSTKFSVLNARAEDIQNKKLYFHGAATQNDLCQTNADGNFTLFNSSDSLQVWNRSTNSVDTLPSFSQLGITTGDNGTTEVTTCVLSQKENIVGVKFAENPSSIITFDLKTRQMVKKFNLPDVTASISDYIFMPSNGHLVVYYQQPNETLVVWNHKAGSIVSKKDNVRMSYCRLSPASDRLVMSLKDDELGGKLLLRNSDGNFGVDLKLSARWNASKDASDVEFAADGTIVVGVCAEREICRVWNAGNGEMLQDLSVSFSSVAEVAGMVTNTHVVFRDTCLKVVDVASGDIVAVLPMQESGVPKTSSLGTKISPKGNYIVSCSESGQLRVIQCHNFSAVKRKTTLQRMKSFTK